MKKPLRPTASLIREAAKEILRHEPGATMNFYEFASVVEEIVGRRLRNDLVLSSLLLSSGPFTFDAASHTLHLQIRQEKPAAMPRPARRIRIVERRGRGLKRAAA